MRLFKARYTDKEGKVIVKPIAAKDLLDAKLQVKSEKDYSKTIDVNRFRP